MDHGPAVQLNITPEQLERIGTLAREDAGIVIAPTKVAMVQSRLAKRLRQLKMSSFDDYINHVASPNGRVERREMISALTTNVSSFFREKHHFDLLSETCLPALDDAIKKGETVRIWSAGCSNGQEPYSIAMTILEYAPNPPEKAYKILATDIDATVLRHAKQGRYSSSMTNELSENRKNAFFTPCERDLQASPDLQRLISFRELNLFSDWPISSKLDVIFCRNVMIYFDENKQANLWERFRNVLKLGGWLCVGHSERLPTTVAQHFERAGITAYRRVS